MRGLYDLLKRNGVHMKWIGWIVQPFGVESKPFVQNCKKIPSKCGWGRNWAVDGLVSPMLR